MDADCVWKRVGKFHRKAVVQRRFAANDIFQRVADFMLRDFGFKSGESEFVFQVQSSCFG